MPLNYQNITIANSYHSGGKTKQDRDRCQYWIESKDGEKYLAFKEKGSILRNLPIGTCLKIGWVLDQNTYKSMVKQNKIIQWYEIISTPEKTTYETKAGTLPVSEIDQEYEHLEKIMGLK